MQQIELTKETRVAVLTGAGISAESGVHTFRDKNGIWAKYRIEDVATPEAFKKNPKNVWQFYNERRKQAKTVKPNPAHYALAKLESLLPDENFTLITQNVDNLHKLAGSKKIYPMHGEITKIRCTRCDTVEENLNDLPELPTCKCGSLLRPHIVWFGEMPFYMNEIYHSLHNCNLFMAIGTSGVVYPAAGFLQIAKSTGATTIGINLEKPENLFYIDHFHQGKAGEILPRLIDQWTKNLQL